MNAFTFGDQAFLAATKSSTTPASFANLLRWYKADSFSLANNTPVGGGANPGGVWVDQTGSGDNANNAGGGPAYKTNIVGTKPVIRFQGTAFGDAFGGFFNFAPGALTDLTMIAACARTGTPSLINYNTVTAHQIRRAFFPGDNQILFYQNTGVLATALSGAADDFMVIVVRRAANAVTFRQNKTSRGGGVETGAVTYTQIGASTIGTEMDLGEYMLWNRALSDTEVDSLYDKYLKPRWTTLP